jgi:IS30 family transposase
MPHPVGSSDQRNTINVSIGDRPADVKDRAIPGHWERDLIAGCQNTHLPTLVERKSRFTMMVKVPGQNMAPW